MREAEAPSDAAGLERKGGLLMAKREKGLPANYNGATPEEVALAVLRYRPGKKNKPRPRSKKEDGDTIRRS